MDTTLMLPPIIQGGMGVNISSWLLARTVSMFGQRGTVSGVAAERLMTRMLQVGDPGGHIRRALSHFPFQQVIEKILKTYYVEGGKPAEIPFKNAEPITVKPSDFLISLIVCANYALVWLAKEGHENPIAINYLEKLQMPHIYAITGAMLADVDFITMGAGVAIQIPGLLDNLVADKVVTYHVQVEDPGNPKSVYVMSFSPEDFLRIFGGRLPQLRRPSFIPIIASNVLAKAFKRLPKGSVQGFVIEEPTAGGHNAPPRKIVCDEKGQAQPIYGQKDVVDYKEIADHGLPFWIGGSYASPEKLQWALSVGATGIQVGSIFAFCDESGMEPELRRKIRVLGYANNLKVRTDMRASPTGYPFKVAELEGTLSEQSVYDGRARVCNQGALVTPYRRADGSIGYRCPSERAEIHTAKSGKTENTVGRVCICNGLIATAGLGDLGEPAIVTLGDDVGFLSHVMANVHSSYSAIDAIRYLLSQRS